uniref:division/cell wall cluster transcriptional repressor MraZ n=1 Tax=Eubacterium cellulosolvens TaxID=29322 RepID=UPI00048A32E3|nr:division/cell wall cluster transcriptional repressor MraZ [[Eubacterium] cellulosolvens]
MFKGEYNHTIDSKGRVIIPSKFRDELGEKFVLTRGMDRCLAIYPQSAWDVLEQKLATLPLTSNAASRNIVRFLINGATDCELDKQGRILVPSTLREYAGLTDKEVVLAGTLSYIEVWSKKRWEMTHGFDDMDAITQSLLDSGINI